MVMRIKSIDDLEKIRARVREPLYSPPVLRINVGMASCGIASGAKDAYNKAF